jgi:hypothetical protein
MDREKVVEITGEGGVAVAAFKATSICDVAGVAAAAREVKDFIDANHPGRVNNQS